MAEKELQLGKIEFTDPNFRENESVRFTSNDVKVLPEFSISKKMEDLPPGVISKALDKIKEALAAEKDLDFRFFLDIQETGLDRKCYYVFQVTALIHVQIPVES